MNVTFVTGNQYKLKLLTDYLGYQVESVDLELDEIQSMDLGQIVRHKVSQAYEKAARPVLVEDISVEIKAFGKLPGPLIKWFLQEVGTAGICKMLDNFETRDAISKVCYGYSDGSEPKFFYGEVKGSIAPEPRGDGHGWNPIFIPEGQSQTYAQMSDELVGQKGLRASTVFPQIKEYLHNLDKIR